MSWLERIVLKGEVVTLEPLAPDHIEPLRWAVRDGEFWKLWFANVPPPEQMENYVITAIENAEKGNIAFAVRLNATDGIVGTTRFYNVDEANRRPMLGYTWYAKSACKTGVNTESKLLLLQHVFEKKKALAVEFRTHFFNQVSRSAIERLGAKQDGILRNHQIMRDGSIRDTVIYSILQHEWPSVKNNLLNRLSSNRGEPAPE
ncbi:Protein N-acetyltransferase, RimJ/RimL family [Nitrosospira multiformis ATCC 25196]|uniref:GCN5-related N-acetyltransferase n=1 Tax=Nitrosospira multiformis (strain ATCC 25196 / NCIMB 11849 / C 71) TaxID=323848 RepID=Q2Y784_NITMU|nr:GNAT family protein [Nitrosospira multiformis]ABB75387.1 GCN5-related N-acetyltransferase [Nitrosospira multiformis ATCC 25196]SEG05824.1 Protein N-acetyltransferase, RimJ/RimL family [Nitrosospira multiformis ATCC 25196]